MYTILHDRKLIEQFCRQNIYTHIYSIGDLDNFFWKHTIWYGYWQEGKLASVFLLYVETDLPVLLGLGEDVELLQRHLSAIKYLLPKRFYAHLTPNSYDILTQNYKTTFEGTHLKMGLVKGLPSQSTIATDKVKPIDFQHLAQINELFKESYPDSWFNDRMLETQQYYGIFDGKKLVSIGGIHSYSAQYKVAALGNFTTHPDYRRKGYGRSVLFKLCQNLLKTVDHIGLNVKAGNFAAIDLYQQLGFEIICPYDELLFEA
ncbi:MAG: GNAT family N-acetyltransferase [Aureispira sp.]|nr:GNAT family N-acetyltransferase [Aureispira sp.]